MAPVHADIAIEEYMNERWLSVEEIASHLGVNQDTIYKWIGRKKMPAHKVGRLWKFKVSEVDEWVCGGKAGEIATGFRKEFKRRRRAKE